MHLNKASVGTEVINQVKSLTSEINKLGCEAAKTNSESAWEELISKCDKLRKITLTFGKTKNLSYMEDVQRFADYFKGKTIDVGYKNSGLSGTDFTTNQLKKELKELEVSFTSTKQGAVQLYRVWKEMCEYTGRTDLLGVDNWIDQIQTVIHELLKAKSVLYGKEGLVAHPNPTGDILKYISNVEHARDIVIGLQNELSTFMQNDIQTSNTSTDTVVQNEKRKQQAIQDTAKVKEQLSQNGNIIQQTNFATSFNTKEEAEKYFNALSKIVSIQGKLGENKNLNSFIVEVKNAEGAVEKLIYKYNELTGTFEYSGGSINNNSIQKQIDAINIKASRL